MDKKILLSIVIPVYNEEKTLRALLDAVESVDIPEVEKEIVIVDDCSQDGTRDILKTLPSSYSIIQREKNGGKGSAIREGFLKARGDIVLIQDADLEYDPREFPRILKPILEGRADVVIGSRFIGSEPHRVLFLYHYWGNKVVTFYSNLLSGLNLTDMECCYKVFTRKVLDEIKGSLTATRFGIEPELVARIAKGNWRIYEVGVSYYGRTYAEGKKITWRDGISALWHITKYNLFS
jgi:glycosyltransferase involved in cell wall biosynthesis